MKLLFDESLSPRLVLLLSDPIPESNAIRIAELPNSQDGLIFLDR